jgi:hypothetical protein
LAARHLLVDANLWVLEVYNTAEESPLQRLAALTLTSTFPAIRIAHCIRDLSYGDKSRVEELKRMIESPDPEYQSIFREAYWID